MSEWKELSKLVERKIGYGIVQPGNTGGNVPVIKVNNIINGLVSPKGLETTTEEIASKYERTKLKGGELIISLVGTVGATAIVPKSFAGCNLVRATGMVDIKDLITAKYVKYYLETRNAKEYLYGRLNTTVQPTLNIKTLEKLPIPIINRKMMVDIVTILSSLDDKIAVNRRICENLEAQAQALFKHWFIDFAPFKDGKFVESELGMIPEGWKVGKLEDLCIKVGSGGTPKSSNKNYYQGVIPWFGTGEFNDSFLFDSEKHITKEAIDNSSARLYPMHTVLIAMYGATVGKLSIISVDATFNQAALALVAHDYIGYPYVFLSLLNCRKALINLACGAAQQNLNAGNIKSFKSIIPNKKVMGDFNDIILPLFELIEEFCKENLRLSTLRDTLLPKLMSGQIKV